MKVVLDGDSENLEEVVVIGYGTVKRKDLTTAVSTVGGKDIDNRPIISAAQALQGKAAGIAVSSPNGAPGGGMTIRVRGTTSMNGSNDPLYVVDGVPVDNISFLAPNDIESMQILKDASATAIYGSRGANGVILISTKHASSGKAQVSLNIQGGFTRVVKKIDVLNYMQYKELQDEIGLVAVPGRTFRHDRLAGRDIPHRIHTELQRQHIASHRKAQILLLRRLPARRRYHQSVILSAIQLPHECGKRGSINGLQPKPTYLTLTIPQTEAAQWARGQAVAV